MMLFCLLLLFNLSELNDLSAAGMDGLHHHMLRACSEEQSLPLYSRPQKFRLCILFSTQITEFWAKLGYGTNSVEIPVCHGITS